MEFLLARHQQGHQRSSPPCETCTWFQSQNAAAPPHTYTHTILPMPDVCHRYLHARRNWPPGSGWLLLKDDLCLMSSTWPEQCQQDCLTAERDVSEHAIPKVLHSDNGPQYASAQFANFCMSWGISHKTSSPHYPQSNGFTEACVKSAKHALQWAKYSGANPHLALLALRAMPINSKLPFPAELLYQCQLRTTILAKICNSDPSALQVCEQIDTHSKAVKSQADKHSKTLAPMYAGQPVATYDSLQWFWFLLLWYMSSHGAAI